MTVAVDAVGLRWQPGPVVLDGIELAVEPGSLCVLLGPNGGGKTSTLGLRRAFVSQDQPVELEFTVLDLVLIGRGPTSGASTPTRPRTSPSPAAASTPWTSPATAIVSLHDPQLAAGYADHVVVVHRGTVVAAGPPAATITESLLVEVWGVHAEIITDAAGRLRLHILGIARRSGRRAGRA